VNKKLKGSQIGKIVVVPIVNPTTREVSFKLVGQVKGVNYEKGILEIGDVSSICGYDPVKPIRYRSGPIKIKNPN